MIFGNHPPIHTITLLHYSRQKSVGKLEADGFSVFFLLSNSIGVALTDALDDLISDGRIAPQLAMKILSNFDRSITEVLSSHVKSKLQFKVRSYIYLYP